MPRAESGPAGNPYPLRQDKEGNFTYKDPTFRATIQRDGTLVFDDRSNVQLADKETIKREGPSLKFDLTDAVMRAVGDDPYLARKRCFAQATESLRHDLRRKHLEEVFAHGLSSMSRHLASVWKRHSQRGDVLRRRLFELWDECEERYPDKPEPPDKLETQRQEKGQWARHMVICFIRQKLPCGSPQAYTEDELRVLNRERKSHQRFEPYGVLPRSCDRFHPG